MTGIDGSPDFAVACGEEASDPTVLHDGSIVRVDELAASYPWSICVTSDCPTTTRVSATARG